MILGGGVGGMTVAHQLSRPGWQARFESITLYQRGWRLGGKGASGRDAANADRIEEHGLHIWLGFYENAFRMMRDCYEELGRPPGAPLRTTFDAFEKASRFVVMEDRPEGWVPWVADFPEDDTLPGEPDARLPSPWEYVLRALDLARRMLGSVQGHSAPATVQATPASGPSGWATSTTGPVQ
ncbi:MAG TPA: NAD(P)-binding protein, partial [Acidimicrobiia bacterium]|nr:NAD(P)-binding protein [Acidimicrobiia bacterium]